MHLSRWIAVFALSTLSYAQTPARPANQQKPSSDAEKERSGYDPLLDLPSLPNAKLTLLGGIVAKVDPIQDHLELRDFGGGKTDIVFDLRTKILRDGAPGSVKDIQSGRRVYVDTMLNGDRVFAKTIRVETGADQGDARGQVVSLDTGRGTLTLREEVAPRPFLFRLTPETAVMINGQRSSASQILPGALVTIKFAGGGDQSMAREIRVLANPGENFTFVGKVTFLDLRLKRFAVANQSDNETYDLTLEKLGPDQIRGLKVGSAAVVKAVFDGKNYEARSIELTPTARDEARQ